MLLSCFSIRCMTFFSTCRRTVCFFNARVSKLYGGLGNAYYILRKITGFALNFKEGLLGLELKDHKEETGKWLCH